MPPPPPLHYAGASPYQPESPCTNQDGTTLSSEKQNSFNLTSATGSGEHPATQPGAREQTNTRVIRPLTVNEALQYSPFSSIVPFNSGIISLPNSYIPYSQHIFNNPTERRSARQHIEYLDARVVDGTKQSGYVNNALGSLQSLLDPSRITEFYFKPPSHQINSIPLHPPLKSKTGSNVLGPFANMVLKVTNVAYRYPTPASPGVSDISVKPFEEPKATLPVTPFTPSPTEQNKHAFIRNAHIKEEKGQSPGLLKVQPTVVVSSQGLSSDREKYKSYEESFLVTSKSKKRKRDGDEELETNDQKALSLEALRNLQVLIGDIFDAEDSFNIEDERSIVGKTLVLSHGADGDSVTLAFDIQIRLESSLHKVISFGRLRDIPLGDLSRLLKLCEGAFSSVDGVDVGIQSEWQDDNILLWLENLEVIYTAFRSARTALRIMTGGREEKQLYPEELLQKIIDVLRKVTDTCIVPMVEARSSGPRSEIFRLMSANKKALSQLLHGASKIMHLLVELLSGEELSEGPVIALEFFTIPLLFAENAANEKESVLGIHKFEAFRRTAMNMIAEIFSRYPEQRQFIVNEVLSSLQKLPTTRQHGRQFKLADGKRLQLTSVLLMRLVSNSGTYSSSIFHKKAWRVLPGHDSESSIDSANGDSDAANRAEDALTSEEESGVRNHHNGVAEFDTVPKRFVTLAKSLFDSAGGSAQHIVNFLVQRASTSSKTGEQPHRHLLDMFVEDLVAVLSWPEWPSAELLLRALVSKMIDIAESSQSTAPAKNMALEILGMMGSAILDVTYSARQTVRGLENDESRLTELLQQQLDDHISGTLGKWDLASWEGTFRIILEYLGENKADPQSLSAQAYHLMQWIKFVFWGHNSTSAPPDDLGKDRTHRDLAVKLGRMLVDTKWSSAGYSLYSTVSISQCRLAYLLTLLNVGFCRAFIKIFNILINSVRSDQITVKTRSLKSVAQMLEKDPSLFDRASQVNNLVLKCVSDQSSMVRDNALALVGKCIMLKPILDPELLKSVLVCTRDSTIGIRKRAIKLLKDIYQRDFYKDVKAVKDLKIVLSENFLQCVEDSDEGTSELARQTLEDIWLSPFWGSANLGGSSVQDRVSLKDQISLIIQTIQRNDQILVPLGAFLRYSMSDKSKNLEANLKVNKAFLIVAFDGMVDSTELPGNHPQTHVLQALTVFARANPKLFTQQQLEYLQPYISNLTTTDDLNLFRRVVVILRCVLPTLPAVQKDFLSKVQGDLLRNVSKLAKTELNEVAACLWTINGVLQNIEKLVGVEVNVLKGLHKVEAVDFSQMSSQNEPNPALKQELIKAQRLIHLAGHFGHHCDFEPQLERFRKDLPWLPGNLVSAKIVAAIKPFVAKQNPLALRVVGLESMGLVCQSWPQNFTKPDIVSIFQGILREDHHDLQRIILICFRDFFMSQDQQLGLKASTESKGPLENGKLVSSVTVSDKDGAAALIAQNFIQAILRIAKASQDDYALAATEVIASITRQGLVHPKECGSTLVALGTSTNPRIADVAFQQHQTLHLQHESMFEREYMRAIHDTFLYQRNIVKDGTGFTRPSFRAKLHSIYEVIKTSKSKAQVKFLSNYCARIDFDLAKLDVSKEISNHLEYSKFLIENLAFFDYVRMEDLLHVLACIEKVVGGTGAGIAHAINTEVFKLVLDPETGTPLTLPARIDAQSIDLDPTRFRKLTTASMILSMLWQARTFIRRLYGISGRDNRREGRGRPSKDLSKAPPKNNSVTGDKVVESILRISRALDNQQLSLEQCKEFTELLAIDNEVKVDGDGDEDEDEGGRIQTPSIDDDDGSTALHVGSGSKISKRKGSTSLNGTPLKKKRGRPPLSGKKAGRKSMDEEDWD